VGRFITLAVVVAERMPQAAELLRAVTAVAELVQTQPTVLVLLEQSIQAAAVARAQTQLWESPEVLADLELLL
jgi:hypothetical protein